VILVKTHVAPLLMAILTAPFPGAYRVELVKKLLSPAIRINLPPASEAFA